MRSTFRVVSNRVPRTAHPAVLTDLRTRAAYSEGAGIYRIVPAGVAIVHGVEAAQQLVRWAARHKMLLLIVGGADPIVITLNRQALRRLQCRNKQLVVVPGATHLFEEPGKLEEVAQAAADWFAHFLVPNWWNKGTRTVRASRAR